MLTQNAQTVFENALRKKAELLKVFNEIKLKCKGVSKYAGGELFRVLKEGFAEFFGKKASTYLSRLLSYLVSY
jgi:hypothetical protein